MQPSIELSSTYLNLASLNASLGYNIPSIEVSKDTLDKSLL